MKKILIATICSILSISAYAKNITVELTPEEIGLAIHLADKYEIPMEAKGPCTKTEYTIIDIVKGFNPASWIIKKEKFTSKLAGEEIQGLIEIYNRLKVPAKFVDSITSRSEITISGSSCGFTPYKWTATFDNLK